MRHFAEKSIITTAMPAVYASHAEYPFTKSDYDYQFSQVLNSQQVSLYHTSAGRSSFFFNILKKFVFPILIVIVTVIQPTGNMIGKKMTH
jgi:hypothetical protein